MKRAVCKPVGSAVRSVVPGSRSSTHGGSTLYLCGSCKEPVTWNDMGVMCEDCESWFHIGCQGIGENTYERLGNRSVVWTCL